MKKILGLILLVAVGLSSNSFASQPEFINSDNQVEADGGYILQESTMGIDGLCYMGTKDIDEIFSSVFEVNEIYTVEEYSFKVTGYSQTRSKTLIINFEFTDMANEPDTSYEESAHISPCNKETVDEREKEIQDEQDRIDRRELEKKRTELGPPPIINDGEIIYIESEGISALSLATDPETKYPNIDPNDLCYVAGSGDSVEESIEALVEDGVLMNSSETGEFQTIYYNPDSRTYDVELYASKIEDEGEHPYYTVSIDSCENAPEENDYLTAAYKFELQNMVIDEDYEHNFYGKGLCMNVVYDEEEIIDYSLDNADLEKALNSLDLDWEFDSFYGDSTAAVNVLDDDEKYIGSITMNICE